MTLNEYETITGITVPVAQQAKVTAQITKTQRILERMLGFTLDQTSADDNEYTEIGKTPSECPCPDVDLDTLDDPDAVVDAYRLYSYNKKDSYLYIDPCAAVNAVKLVKDGITFKTFESDEYRAELKQGIIKYLENCDDCCVCTDQNCYCTQLAVDADWLWDANDTIPDELLQVWAEMTTYYADKKNNIKSQTLGSHSWQKFDDIRPEQEEHNLAVIQKYSGPNGSVFRTPTI